VADQGWTPCLTGTLRAALLGAALRGWAGAKAVLRASSRFIYLKLHQGYPQRAEGLEGPIQQLSNVEAAVVKTTKAGSILMSGLLVLGSTNPYQPKTKRREGSHHRHNKEIAELWPIWQTK
jgi:hypothetical protein